MSHKTIYFLTIGSGLVFGSYLENLRKNFFKISAQTESDFKKLDKNAPYLTYGYPKRDIILENKNNVIISFDKRLHIPNWVYEHLTTRGSSSKSYAIADFEEDYKSQTSEYNYLASDWDYKDSGFRKGYMAPIKGNCKRELLMANVAPQSKLFNEYAWNDLNSYIIARLEYYPNVYVCTGPLFLRKSSEDRYAETGKVEYQVIGNKHVAVPTHFFKVIAFQASSGRYRLESYIFPNEKINFDYPLDEYCTFIDEVEKLAGFRIFSSIDEKEAGRQELEQSRYFQRTSYQTIADNEAPVSTQETPRQHRCSECVKLCEAEEEEEKKEAERQKMEEERTKAETDRELKNEKRINNEQCRRESDKKRNNTEAVKQRNFEARQNNEKERDSAEIKRQEAEKDRQKAENERENNENERLLAEVRRQQAEMVRQKNEAERQLSENKPERQLSENKPESQLSENKTESQLSEIKGQEKVNKK